MRSLWLIFLPLLFLPNIGTSSTTAFGALEISDYLIGPYIGLVLLTGRWGRRSQVAAILPAAAGFFIWAFLSTATIWLRYEYGTDRELLFSLLKLAKLALYAVAGLLTAQALASAEERARFHWAVLAAGTVTGTALLSFPEEAKHFSAMGYKASNAVSALTAMLVCYLGALLVTGQGTRRWRRAAGPALMILLLGFFLSRGRGGWVAAVVGAAYLLYHTGFRRRVVQVVGVLSVVVISAYFSFPLFRNEVDKTLWPDQAYAQHMARYNSGVAGVDDGARLYSWASEAVKFMDAPLLGTGFFHRGGATRLWTTGSHNFWLQMFLETGVVGGALMLAVLWAMWRTAGTRVAREQGVTVPVRASLLAAFVGGISGEYLYGGMVLFTLLLVFAPAGGLARPAVSTGVPRPAGGVLPVGPQRTTVNAAASLPP